MIAGVAIFITKLDPSSLSYKGIGDLLIFGKVVVVGFTNVYAQKAVSDKRTDAVTFGRFLFALPFLLLMVLLFGKFDFTGNLLYTALSGISFGVGTMLFYEGIRLTDASTGSNFNLTTPIYGMILGALFLGETYVPVQFLGAATIIVGGFFLVREKARENALRPSRS
jgi:drug/metabolite transporter (DMT)-like permease